MAMTDISGPLAHQLPLHNHRGGLVQPSLVMNHHLDMECMSKSWYCVEFLFVLSFIFIALRFGRGSSMDEMPKTQYLLLLSTMLANQKYKLQFDIFCSVCVCALCARWCCGTVWIVKSAFKLRLRMRHHNANTISGFVVPFILSSLSFRHIHTHRVSLHLSEIAKNGFESVVCAVCRPAMREKCLPNIFARKLRYMRFRSPGHYRSEIHLTRSTFQNRLLLIFHKQFNSRINCSPSMMGCRFSAHVLLFFVNK